MASEAHLPGTPVLMASISTPVLMASISREVDVRWLGRGMHEHAAACNSGNSERGQCYRATDSGSALHPVRPGRSRFH
jgi:hypothetical protein